VLHPRHLFHHPVNRCVVLAALGAFGVLGVPLYAQPVSASAVQPLRTVPTEKVTIRTNVRDYGPATLAGTTLYVGNPTGGGALFAIDTVRNRVAWTFRAQGISSSVSTAPVVVGDLVIAPFGAALPGAVIAVSKGTGKEVWRAVDPSASSAVVAEGNRLFVVSKECTLHALDAATGRELWKTPLRFVPGGSCSTSPVVRDGSVYAQIMARAPEGTAGWPDARYMAAFDAATGAERWRHRPLHPDYRQGAAPGAPVVTDRGVYFPGENALYALDRATGQPLFAPVFLRRPIDGRERAVALDSLFDAGPVLVGATKTSLIAFDKDTGRIAWELAGAFKIDNMAFAAAGPVLYFQGGLDGAPAFPGTLHALDMTTNTRLWSFQRTGKDPEWTFGHVVPVDGGVWVDGHAAMLKLQ
jgi:outer membrane protein assembly factor BamB